MSLLVRFFFLLILCSGIPVDSICGALHASAAGAVTTEQFLTEDFVPTPSTLLWRSLQKVRAKRKLDAQPYWLSMSRQLACNDDPTRKEFAVSSFSFRRTVPRYQFFQVYRL
jgi:hypothetical protein